MPDGISSATRDSLRKIAVALAHLWIVQWWLEAKMVPVHRAEYYVYKRDLGWGVGVLDGKRIKITLSVEAANDGMPDNSA